MTPGAAITEFALLSLLVEVTPGPNMAYLALVAATEGRAKGYAAVLGVALGLGLMGLLAALGLATLVTAQPALFQGLKWAGFFYLLWLAWQGWAAAGEAVGHAAIGSSAAQFFRRGLVTNLLNPKAALFYVTMLPGFIDPSTPVMPQSLMLSAVYVAIATGVHAGLVTLAGAVQGLVAESGQGRRVRRVQALALVAVAGWMALQ